MRPRLWQVTHQQLLTDDAAYREQFQTYLTAVIVLSCALLIFYLPFFGIPLFGFWINLAIIVSLTSAIVFLSVWQLCSMSRSIRRAGLSD
jgi:hypothetical protein